MTNKEIYEALRSDIQKNGIRTVKEVKIGTTRIEFTEVETFPKVERPVDKTDVRTEPVLKSSGAKNYNKVKDVKED